MDITFIRYMLDKYSVPVYGLPFYSPNSIWRAKVLMKSNLSVIFMVHVYWLLSNKSLYTETAVVTFLSDTSISAISSLFLNFFLNDLILELAWTWPWRSPGYYPEPSFLRVGMVKLMKFLREQKGGFISLPCFLTPYHVIERNGVVEWVCFY